MKITHKYYECVGFIISGFVLCQNIGHQLIIMRTFFSLFFFLNLVHSISKYLTQIKCVHFEFIDWAPTTANNIDRHQRNNKIFNIS